MPEILKKIFELKIFAFGSFLLNFRMLFTPLKSLLVNIQLQALFLSNQ